MHTVLAVRSCDCGLQGPENLILAMAERFASQNVRYVIANLWDGEPPSVVLHEEALRRGLETHVLTTSWGLDPRIVLRLTALVKQLKPDVIHTHDVKAEFAGVVAARLTRTPLIGSFYGRLAVHSMFLKCADMLRFPVFQLFDRVLANSQAQYAELVRWRVPVNRIETVPSFVDVHLLQPPTSAEVAAARQRLDISPTRLVLSTVAKLSPNKGHTYMLQALAKICAEKPEALYLVAGEGDAYWRGEGGLRDRLEQETVALGIKDKVRFLGYYPDLKTVLYATDLVVSPSLLEGMQVSLLEAMAAGRPIVATAIGGTPDAIVDGQTGLLVPPADASALASAILPLLDDHDRLREMGGAGRQRAEERFDVQIVADQVLRVCKEVVATT